MPGESTALKILGASKGLLPALRPPGGGPVRTGPKSSSMQAEEARRGLAAWRQVCQQVEGLALGSSLAALLPLGLASGLLDEVPLGRLGRALGAHPGPLHALVRSLALAGWIERHGEPGSDGMTARLTPRGRKALAGCAVYRLVPEMLERVERWREDRGDLAPWLNLGADRWGLGRHDPDAEPVQFHLDGHLALPLLDFLRGAVGSPPPEVLDLEILNPTTGERAALPRYLRALGWMHPQGNDLTQQGHKAWQMAGLAAYPLSYLALIRAAPELLLGDAGWLDRRGEDGREVHLDREADVRFSGEVSLGLVEGPLAELVLPVFDDPDLDRQPRCLLDVGCGDGRMLVALARLIRRRTLRGRHLHSHPLRLVGAEFEEAAARVAEPVLAAEEPGARVLFGDIADPEGLERGLRSQGTSLREALVLAKSVVHNRRLSIPEEPTPLGRDASRAAFLDGAGRVVPGARVEADLCAVFRRWRPYLVHGMAVAEPHALEESEAPSLVGRNVAAPLEYTHALSRQHLVEARIHARAAREAGLASRIHRATGRQTVGYESMTFDLFVPTP